MQRNLGAPGSENAAGRAYDGVTAVDSATTVPVMRVYRRNADGSRGTFLAEAAPNNISAGSSGWQYFTVLTATATRPAYTWQYNLKQVDASGVPWGPGNYLVDIEVTATSQCRPLPPMTAPNSCPADGKGPVKTVQLTLTP